MAKIQNAKIWAEKRNEIPRRPEIVSDDLNVEVIGIQGVSILDNKDKTSKWSYTDLLTKGGKVVRVFSEVLFRAEEKLGVKLENANTFALSIIKGKVDAKFV